MKPYRDERMKTILPYLIAMVVVFVVSFASGYLKAKFPDHELAIEVCKIITFLLLGGVYVIYQKKNKRGTS
ncbi:hypothetical protein SAMN02745166_00523 [Prosthecobacter debontii]|uniref:Uncharacterized protein n=1 Tax=Prosthecobacter debontii TaxID=48467 RepID=A0A1T4WQN4_9BACT|nr:hypothetical protein [Prosthecobacter debontii]SKA79653.1 hypothetical protein SAMN02745166_00523 [Prosthecobacter debontii]